MRPVHAVSRLWLLVAGTLLCAAPALADSVRLIAADEHGVTLRFDLEGYSLSALRPDGRVEVDAPGLRLLDVPGRPQLPFASALIAIPHGARASAQVISGGAEESREGVAVALGEKIGFRLDPGMKEATPTIEAVAPLAGGAWPASDVTLGEPFTFRRQRMIAVEVHPFRFDETARRLSVQRTLTIRLNFSGAPVRAALAPSQEDRYFEPVLRGAVLNYEQGRSWRSEPSLARGGASLFGPRAVRPAGSGPVFGFDESEPEVRVRIDSTGVWALDYDELAVRNYPASVPISEVSVHRHEFVEGQTVPYATLELPIEVDDSNSNNVFDSGDRILVYVQDWATRSGTVALPQRVWGDAEVVYATRVRGRAGLRVGGRDGTPSRIGLTPLASYPWSQRFEGNFASILGFPADTLQARYGWTGAMFYYVRPDTVMFETNHLDTTQAVSFAVRLMGRAGDEHVVFGAVQNRLGQLSSLFDSSTVSWAGKSDITIPSSVTGSALSEGRFNHMVFWGKNESLAPPDPLINNRTNAGLDWFDVTYWRRYRALSGYLACNSAQSANAAYELYATGFQDTTGIRAYDVTDPLDPRRVTGLKVETVAPFSFALRMQDSTGASQRRYVMFNAPKYPPTDRYTAVTRYALENNTAGDYLLIVPEAFRTVMQPLVDLRIAQGMSVVVAPAEGIYDEFNGGRHSAYAIKRFIKYAYNNWNARFVLLAGDGAGEDPQNFYGSSGVDWIPTQMLPSPVPVYIPNTGDYASELQPADPWYVWCVDPSCTDPSLAPKLHDLYFGRLPVNSAAEAASVVQKLVNYENVSAADAWRRRILLSADDEFSGENLFGGGATPGYCQRNYETRFRQLNETIQSVILNEAGLRRSEVELFNEQDYINDTGNLTITLPCPACVPDTCRTDRNQTISNARSNVTPRLFTRLNSGRLWWNFQGHANESVLSHESFYQNDPATDDNTLYSNASLPFLFSAFSCHSNNFGRYYERLNQATPLASLGERMVTVPNDRGGAIASWASVGYEIIPSNGVSHINVEFARALFSRPPRDPDLSDRGSRVVLGEAIALALVRWEPQVRGDPLQRSVGMSYTLLGDPATRLSIGSPQALVTANGDTVTDNLPVRLHTLGDTLRLEADLVSNQKIDTLWIDRSIDGGPSVLIPATDYTVTPAFPDTAASGNGGRRYHLVYRTTLLPSSYRFTFHTIDRDGVPGAFNAVFLFQTVLRVDGTPINDGDAVAPSANLSLLVLSPAPISPRNDLALTINGVPQVFDTLAVASDPSRREWILSWQHPDYPVDTYDVRLTTSSNTVSTHSFRVDVGGNELKLKNTLAFPNPFEDDLGTFFSFNLTSGTPADVLIRVYTVSGRLIYTTTQSGMQPGYHQIPWDGRDSDGSRIANGIYVYRLVARSPTATASHEGRLVKIRRPRRAADVATP